MGPYAKSLNGSDRSFKDVDTVVSGASSSGELGDVNQKYGIALKGNGHDEELSKEQLQLIFQLHDRVASYREALPAHDAEFCDYETCRRYLVARQWCLSKAEAQLLATLKWRVATDPAGREFWQSSKSLKNPYAQSMRLVGWDSDGRPITYVRFSEAYDRYDGLSNLEHMTLLLEASCKILRQRRKQGLNQLAHQRQCVWVVDFDGFGLRDQNPKSAMLTAHLLQHYPEMMHCVVLIDAPMLFNGLFKLISPVLDDRVRTKIMFIKGKHAAPLLDGRFGSEAAQWLERETLDSAEKKKLKGQPHKKYWVVPKEKGQHDSRGFPSYVSSEMYVKTPGEAYEAARCDKLTQVIDDDESEEALVDEPPPTEIVIHTKSIYAGSF